MWERFHSDLPYLVCHTPRSKTSSTLVQRFNVLLFRLHFNLLFLSTFTPNKSNKDKRHTLSFDSYSSRISKTSELISLLYFTWTYFPLTYPISLTHLNYILWFSDYAIQSPVPKFHLNIERHIKRDPWKSTLPSRCLNLFSTRISLNAKTILYPTVLTVPSLFIRSVAGSSTWYVRSDLIFPSPQYPDPFLSLFYRPTYLMSRTSLILQQLHFHLSQVDFFDVQSHLT